MLNYYLNPFKDESWDNFFNTVNATSMATDIVEKENEYLFDIELPGYSKEDVKISVSDGYLTIEAEKKFQQEKKHSNFIKQERRYGTLTRSYYVGSVDINNVKASFENGVLTINVPKQQMQKNYIQIA